MAAEHQIIFDRPTPGTNKTESGYIFHLEEAHIMGILNVTPDSFSDGNKYIEVDAALAHAKQMISDVLVLSTLEESLQGRGLSQ